MLKFVILLALLVHSGHGDRVYDTECPAIEPMADFDMERVSFLLLFSRVIFIKKKIQPNLS